MGTFFKRLWGKKNNGVKGSSREPDTESERGRNTDQDGRQNETERQTEYQPSSQNDGQTPHQNSLGGQSQTSDVIQNPTDFQPQSKMDQTPAQTIDQTQNRMSGQTQAQSGDEAQGQTRDSVESQTWQDTQSPIGGQTQTQSDETQSQTEDDAQSPIWHETRSPIDDEMRSQAGDQTQKKEAVDQNQSDTAEQTQPVGETDCRTTDENQSLKGAHTTTIDAQVGEEHDSEADGFSSVDKADVPQGVGPEPVMTPSRSGRIMSLLSRTKFGRRDRHQGRRSSYQLPGAEQESLGPMSIEDLKERDIVIAVMGPTGSGKSTFVHSASGRETQGVGGGLKSFTSDVRAIRFQDQESGQSVVLVDTPGFDDTYKSDLDILNMISEWLSSSYKKDKLLSAILYLHRITDNRVAGTSLKNLRVFRKLCGDDALEKVYFTATMWDEVAEDVGKRRLEELKSVYWKKMIDHGAQVFCCGDIDGPPKKLVRKILEEADSREVLLQREIVALEKEIKETEAGQELYSHLEVLVQKQTEIIRRLSEAREAAKDPQLVSELEGQLGELRKQVDERFRDMQKLKLSVMARFLSNPAKLLRSLFPQATSF